MPPLWTHRTPPLKMEAQLKSLPASKLRRRLIAAVIEHHGRPHPKASIAVNRRHVRTGHTIVLEVFVVCANSHCLYALRNQLAYRVIRHRARNGRPQAETIRQIRSHVKLAATHMDTAFCVALRNGTMPGSSLCTSAPSERKSNSALSNIFNPRFANLAPPILWRATAPTGREQTASRRSSRLVPSIHYRGRTSQLCHRSRSTLLRACD